jgi:hypothetical protein
MLFAVVLKKPFAEQCGPVELERVATMNIVTTTKSKMNGTLLTVVVAIITKFKAN